MKVRFRLPNKGTADKPIYDQHSPIYIRFGSALTPSGYLVDKDHWQIPKPLTITDKKKSTSKHNPRVKRPNFEQGLKNNFKPIELEEHEVKKGFKALSDTTLSEITTFILSQEQKTPKNVNRDSKWLKSVMNLFHGISSGENDSNYFRTNLKKFLDKKDIKKDIYRKGQHPILKRFLDYERSVKNDFTNDQLDAEFSELYGAWAVKRGSMPSYVKSDLIHFKNALKLASKLGYEISITDWKYPSDKKKPKPVTLTWDEIDLLYNHKFERKSLENIRATLLISCFTALRYSDVYKVKGDLINKDRLKIKVDKTNSEVMLPIHPRVKQILKDVDVYQVSLSYFDKKVKDVCRLVGIKNKTFGRLRGMGVEPVEREKHVFASSHIGRRSFATNHYNKLPTTIIMACTGHATETMFLKYIGETDDQHVDVVLDYWEKLDKERGVK